CGATAARYLRMWGNVDVTLVERDATFISCPISNMVLGGHKTMADITVPYSGLDALGVKRIEAEVVAIDAQAKEVRLADGRKLPYDRAIVSPGIDFMFDQVAGLTPAAQQRILHAWKAGPQTLALRRQLEAMPDGGVRTRRDGGQLLQAAQAALEGVAARRQPRDPVEESAVREGVCRAVQGHHRIPPEQRVEGGGCRRQHRQARVRRRQGRRAQRRAAAPRRRDRAQHRLVEHERALDRRQLADDGVDRGAWHPSTRRRRSSSC